MPSSGATLRETSRVLQLLLANELALYVNPVVETNGWVSWPARGDQPPFLRDREPPSIYDYRIWVESGAYSAMLADGALLQISFHFGRNDLLAHRLALVPNPFLMDSERLLLEGPLDLFDEYAQAGAAVVLPRAVVRFDYDIAAIGAGHPAAHLTLNSDSCRVPCAGPLRLGHFIDFVFRHFYPLSLTRCPALAAISKTRWRQHTYTDDERRLLHLAWPAT